jgi:uncharacterized iron-regulated membrane protein
MKAGFRQSMAWLHTWTGLIVGWVLYFVFLTGTIGYFYVEVDRWMRPELPLAGTPAPLPRLVAAADDFLRREAPHAQSWWIEWPVHRDESRLAVSWTTGGPRSEPRHVVFDPATRQVRVITVRQTGGGYELYRMHWGLHYLSGNRGFLFVGLCTVVLLIALLTGVITHKKIFVDLLTFRPGPGQRSWLDAHTVASVLALPFFLMMTYSGLAFYRALYMPAAVQVLYGGDHRAFGAESEPSYRTTPAHRTAPMLPLEHFVAEAARYWSDDPAWWWLQVVQPGDAHAEVRLWRADNRTILYDGEQLQFNAVDGRLIRRVTGGGSMAQRTQSALLGLHVGGFAGPLLRWLYFLSGVLGCAMIATGLVLWTVKRRAKALRNGNWGMGHRLVEQLNIGTIAGLPVGVAAYFWANRLLPAGMADRAAWEMHVLFITWGVMLVYPALRRPMRAWVEELSFAGLAFGLLPIVNALTTGRHLGVTIPHGDWAIAGVDLTVLAFGLLFAIMARTVHGATREATAPHRMATLAMPASQETMPAPASQEASS